MDKLVKSGRIRFAGFSFHDELNLFKEIINAYDWSVCQIQFNFYDQDAQAGREAAVGPAVGAHGVDDAGRGLFGVLCRSLRG